MIIKNFWRAFKAKCRLIDKMGWRTILFAEHVYQNETMSKVGKLSGFGGFMIKFSLLLIPICEILSSKVKQKSNY